MPLYLHAIVPPIVLESAQLIAEDKLSLNRFQLRGLRKILKMPVAMVDRNYTNAEVLLRANSHMKKPAKPAKQPKQPAPGIWDLVEIRQTFKACLLKSVLGLNIDSNVVRGPPQNGTTQQMTRPPVFPLRTPNFRDE